MGLLERNLLCLVKKNLVCFKMLYDILEYEYFLFVKSNF